MRKDLIRDVRAVLAQAGYCLSEETPVRPVSFDLVARRDSELLIVKVLANIDAFTESLGQEMRTLAKFLEARALLVGERSSGGPLEGGVAYVRHGIPLVSVETLQEHLLEGVPPLVYAAPGGFYVNVDGARLRALREQRSLSLGQVAEAAGVSRRAVRMYEDGMGVLVDVASRLEEFLQEPLVEPVDLFSKARWKDEPARELASVREAMTREVLATLDRLGYMVAPTERSSFEALSRDADVLILTGVGKPEQDVRGKAQTVASLARVMERPGVLVLRARKTRLSIEGVAVIEQSELEGMADRAKVVETIKDRTKTRVD
ncbi:MAG TPA: transcriptional regulator [Candidatus Thermoplasmatota archaeon]|nr:transcriptional regulator [Candidatus Thermoplasmatota archaeon]